MHASDAENLRKRKHFEIEDFDILRSYDTGHRTDKKMVRFGSNYCYRKCYN